MPDPTKPPTAHQQATAILTNLAGERLHFTEQLAMAQTHATLAVADQIDALDSTLRDLHETLRGAR